MSWYACCMLPAADDALLTELTLVTPRLATSVTESGVLVTLDLGGGTVEQIIPLLSHVQTCITQHSKLCPSIGVSASRIVATIAAQVDAPNTSLRIIRSKQIRAFLAPLSLRLLPISSAVLERLHTFGLRTIGQLATLSSAALYQQFGDEGRAMFQLAHGQDPLPFAPMPTPPALHLMRRFAGAVEDRRVVNAALQHASLQLCQRLEQGGWAVGMLALTLTREDNPPLLLHRTLPQPTTQQRLITNHFCMLLGTASVTHGVTAIRVSASQLTRLQTVQLPLFPPERGAVERRGDLVAALAPRLRSQLVRATLVSPDAHLPEARIALAPWEQP